MGVFDISHKLTIDMVERELIGPNTEIYKYLTKSIMTPDAPEISYHCGELGISSLSGSVAFDSIEIMNRCLPNLTRVSTPFLYLTIDGGGDNLIGTPNTWNSIVAQNISMFRVKEIENFTFYVDDYVRISNTQYVSNTDFTDADTLIILGALPKFKNCTCTRCIDIKAELDQIQLFQSHPKLHKLLYSIRDYFLKHREKYTPHQWFKYPKAGRISLDQCMCWGGLEPGMIEFTLPAFKIRFVRFEDLSHIHPELVPNTKIGLTRDDWYITFLSKL